MKQKEKNVVSQEKKELEIVEGINTCSLRRGGHREG